MKKYVFLILLIGNFVEAIIIGHRGACGHAPENTLKSFKKAIECGADMIEFDVHQCASGELVVIHDDTVDRTTNGTGAVKDLTLSELKKLDAGEGEKIPTLSELFDYIDREVLLYIELKGENTAMPVFKLIQEYVQKKGWDYEDFLVGSFDHDQLRQFKKAAPDIAIAPIISTHFDNPEQYLKTLGAEAVVLSVDDSQGKFFESIIKTELPIFVFTINDPNVMERTLESGVSGIITDYPDRLYNIVGCSDCDCDEEH